jgi:hypothetical protein
MATKQPSRSFNRSPEGTPKILARRPVRPVRFEIEAFPGAETSGGVRKGAEIWILINELF